MKKLIQLNACLVSLLLFFMTVSYAQKVETIDGVRVVHNGKSGKWGKNPKVSLEFVKTIGKLETDDENLAFYMPSDIAVDSQGNIYVLDSGNHRVQKFDSDGQYIATIGNRGQGPGEFNYPLSIDIDSKGYLYISDPQNQRVHILKPDGKEHKTIQFYKKRAGVIRISMSGDMVMGSGGGFIIFGGMGPDEEKSLPKLLKILDTKGEVKKDFGEQRDFKDILLNRMGNEFHFVIVKNGHTYVAFNYQNRIEKYSSDGKLLWKSDRKLNYSTDAPKNKGSMKGSGGMRTIQMPQMNRCSSGIAVDDKNRVWVVTLKRQIKDDESVQTRIRMTNVSGQRSMSMAVDGNTDVRETDMYQLEVYTPDGILLGKLPLNHFVDDIRIEKDRIFLLDKMRGAQYYEYKIIEN